MMRSSRTALLVCIVTCGLFLSCSDDPLVPSGTYVPPTYQATIESMHAYFTSVCASEPDHVYALGNSILHYDGTQWSPVDWPSGLDEARYAQLMTDGSLAVVRSRDVFLHRDGEWSRLEQAPDWLDRFWGRSANDIYALASDVFHYDGTGWVDMNVPGGNQLRAISGNAAGKLVACGWPGRIDVLDGGQWVTGYFDTMLSYNAVAVTPAGRVFVAGSGGNYPFEFRQGVFELVGSEVVPVLEGHVYEQSLQSNGEGIAVVEDTPSGLFARAYENGVWHNVARIDVSFDDVRIVQGEVFAVGYDNLIWHGNASGGARVPLYPDLGRMSDAVTIGDAIYVVGDGAYRYQDGQWTDLDKQYITRNLANGIDGRRPDDIYAVGDEMILHYDGTRWEWINSGFGHRLNEVWVEPDGDVIAVGSAGPPYYGGPVLVEFDGEQWTSRVIDIPTVSSYGFNDVVRIGSALFVVGHNGLLGMKRGTQWYFMRPFPSHLEAIWGYDENHVYVTSSRDNEILFYNGVRWDTIQIEGPTIRDLISIWGTSPSNLFVLCDDGTLGHFNGTQWTAEQNFFARMFSVAGNRRELLAVGYYGAVSYRK
jgi:photosystem II stability/assembly factor-like uncharacterized protein